MGVTRRLDRRQIDPDTTDFHGWQLLDRWLAAPDREARVRRLLTEQLLPADLAVAG